MDQVERWLSRALSGGAQWPAIEEGATRWIKALRALSGADKRYRRTLATWFRDKMWTADPPDVATAPPSTYHQSWSTADPWQAVADELARLGGPGWGPAYCRHAYEEHMKCGSYLTPPVGAAGELYRLCSLEGGEPNGRPEAPA